MKFFCDYCGCRIDANKDTKCPNCGATYKNNESFKEMDEQRKKIESATIEFGNKIFKETTNAMKFSKVFFIIPIIIFIIAFSIILFIFFEIHDSNKKNSVSLIPINKSNIDVRINKTEL